VTDGIRITSTTVLSARIAPYLKAEQKELDRNRLNAAADVLSAGRFLTENALREQELEEERRREREDLKTRPESVIFTYACRLMKGRLRWLRETCLNRIRGGLRSLRRLGRKNRRILESLSLEISALSGFAEDVKKHMVEIIASELENLSNPEPP